MTAGRVVRLLRTKGYGFIAAETGVEFFFHRTDLRFGAFDALKEGAAVTFDADDSPKGPRASNVRLDD